MKLDVSVRGAITVAVDAFILDRYAGEDRPEPELRSVDQALGGVLALALRDQRFEGRVAEVADIHTGGRLAAKRVLVVGLGPRGMHRRDAAAGGGGGGAPGSGPRRGQPRDPRPRRPGAEASRSVSGSRRPGRARCSASTASIATRSSGTATGP